MFLVLSLSSWILCNIADRFYAAPYILAAMLHHIFLIGLVLLLFRSDREQRILAASILIVTVTLVSDFIDSFLSCLILIFRHVISRIPEPLPANWEIGLTAGAGYGFAIAAVYWLSKRLMPVFCGKPRKWYIMLAMPLLMLITVYDVASWGASNGIMVRSGGSMGLYYDQIFSHAEFMFFSLLSMAAAGFYVFGMHRIYLEQEKSDRYHAQIAVYQMLTEQHGRSERLRHDMKNHIIALSALCRHKEWEKIADYLKSMEDIVLDTGGELTGNQAVDALLYQKRKQAEAEQITWECDVRLPKECGIDAFDLCVLFGNVLDNALEACERMPSGERLFIHIQAKAVKQCLLLTVKNSMDRTETYAGGRTNKADSQEHGIGLLNVGDVAERYHGVVRKEAGEGVFTISILMPFPDAAHDSKTAV